MSESKLVLVERFDELAPGVRVVVGCHLCDVLDRGMLFKTVDPGDGLGAAWTALPPFHGHPPDAEGVIDKVTVDARMVKRWLDFDADAEKSALSEAPPARRERVRRNLEAIAPGAFGRPRR